MRVYAERSECAAGGANKHLFLTGAWGKAPQPEADDDSPRAPPPSAPPPPPAGAYNNTYPAIQQPQAPPPPPAGVFNAPPPMAATAPANSFAIQAKEAELKKKEAELADKERRLRQMEDELRASGAVIRKKNWPICYPVMFHSIPDDIPEKSRRVVRELYLAWWVSHSTWSMHVCMHGTETELNLAFTTPASQHGTWRASLMV